MEALKWILCLMAAGLVLALVGIVGAFFWWVVAVVVVAVLIRGWFSYLCKPRRKAT